MSTPHEQPRIGVEQQAVIDKEKTNYLQIKTFREKVAYLASYMLSPFGETRLENRLKPVTVTTPGSHTEPALRAQIEFNDVIGDPTAGIVIRNASYDDKMGIVFLVFQLDRTTGLADFIQLAFRGINCAWIEDASGRQAFVESDTVICHRLLARLVEYNVEHAEESFLSPRAKEKLRQLNDEHQSRQSQSAKGTGDKPSALEPPRCPQCNAERIDTSWKLDKIDYGMGDKKVELTGFIPVRTCTACGFMYTDHVAEGMRDGLVNHYLKTGQTSVNKIEHTPNSPDLDRLLKRLAGVYGRVTPHTNQGQPVFGEFDMISEEGNFHTVFEMRETHYLFRVYMRQRTDISRLLRATLVIGRIPGEPNRGDLPLEQLLLTAGGNQIYVTNDGPKIGTKVFHADIDDSKWSTRFMTSLALWARDIEQSMLSEASIAAIRDIYGCVIEKVEPATLQKHLVPLRYANKPIGNPLGAPEEGKKNFFVFEKPVIDDWRVHALLRMGLRLNCVAQLVDGSVVGVLCDEQGRPEGGFMLGKKSEWQEAYANRFWIQEGKFTSVVHFYFPSRGLVIFDSFTTQPSVQPTAPREDRNLRVSFADNPSKPWGSFFQATAKEDEYYHLQAGVKCMELLLACYLNFAPNQIWAEEITERILAHLKVWQEPELPQ